MPSSMNQWPPNQFIPSDVLCEIFGGASCFSRADLRSCALVCRAFTEPALRVLWKDLPSSLPLWHLLAPVDLAFPGLDSAPDAYFDAVVEAKLWKDSKYMDILLHYSQYIQDLQVGYWHGGDGNPRVERLLCTVLEHISRERVFPALRSIRCGPSPNLIPHLTRLFSETLREVTLLYENCPVEDFAAVVSGLREVSPRVDTIDLTVYPHLDLSGIVGELSMFRRLSILELYGNLPPWSFDTILAIPTLTDVRVISVTEDDSSDMPEPVYVSTELQKIAIGGTCPAVTDVLSGLRMRHLVTFWVELEEEPEEEYISEYDWCFAAFAQSLLSPEKLQHLFIRIGFNDWRPYHPAPLRDALEPLLASLRQLRSFQLEVLSSEFTTDDADFVTISLAWPDLERFELEYVVWNDNGEPIPTPGVLYHFWRNCPRLEVLGLPYLNLRTRIEDFPIPAQPSSHRLRWLRICYIPDMYPQWTEDTAGLFLEDMQGWANYVHSMFPALDLLRDYSGWRAYEDKPGWWAIFKHLRAIHGLPATQ